MGEDDQPRMVDVSEKAVTPRTAIAEALVWLGPELAELLKDSGKTKKGPVLETAIIAGIRIPAMIAVSSTGPFLVFPESLSNSASSGPSQTKASAIAVLGVTAFSETSTIRG